MHLVISVKCIMSTCGSHLKSCFKCMFRMYFECMYSLYFNIDMFMLFVYDLFVFGMRLIVWCIVSILRMHVIAGEIYNFDCSYWRGVEVLNAFSDCILIILLLCFVFAQYGWTELFLWCVCIVLVGQNAFVCESFSC